ncbi:MULTISPECIES: hypothetical protein [unclassified Polaribacter]|uniref:hypothetical protein n=1 Tax=unclassified Polaribacter TaxID=196858 RepID=UPI00140DE5A5|nr:MULTISPECIES: hypothetical protein [unclassified Polaribacter]
MSILDNLKSSADTGTDASKQFISKTFEHTKLKAFQVTALTLSMIIKLFIIGSLIVLGFLFLAISASVGLGQYLGNVAFGYLIVGSFFLVISLLSYFLRKSFDKKVITIVSKIFFD